MDSTRATIAGGADPSIRAAANACPPGVRVLRTVSVDLLRARRPASLEVASLLDKRPCREVEVPLDYVGWTVGADFLVGYGLDAAERYRNLPFVGVLEE